MKIYKVNQIAELNKRSLSSRDFPNFINYLDTSSLTKNRISSTQFLESNFPSRAKRKVKNNTILFSTVRPDQEHYGILEDLQIENLIVSTGFTTIDIISKDIAPKYLFYLLTQPSIIQYLQGIAENSVSAYPSIKPEEIGELKFRFPNILTQQKIAKVLSDLDAKIELNNRINAELEAMVKLVYAYWFVQFDFPVVTLSGVEGYKSSGGKMVWNEELKREIPEGWRSGNIMEIADFYGGGTPKTNVLEYWNGEYNFYTPADYEESIFSLNTKEKITEKGLKNCSSKLFQKGTIFITARGSVGKINISSEPMAMNQSCYALFGKRDLGYPFVFQHVTELVNYIKAKASGSIFNALVTNDFKFTKLPIPPDNLIEAYNEQTLAFIEKILANKKQNQQLSSLRDWLLPMLMNGQVRLDGLGDLVEEEELGMVAEPQETYQTSPSKG